MSLIHIARHGQSLGSFHEDEVREGISSKRFVRDDLVWRVGMSDWSPLHEVADAWGFDTALLGEAPMDDTTMPPDCCEPAWERRDTVGFFRAIYETIQMVLLAPNMTFSRLRRSGGLMSPLFYYLMMASGTLALRMMFELPLIFKNPSILGPQLAALSHRTITMGALAVVVLSPIFFFCAIFLTSAVTHLSLKIVKGAKEPFEATFRTFCYTLGSVSVCQLIPVVGGIIATLWSIVSYFIGLRKVHEISAWRTFFAILISTILSSMIVMMVAAMVILGFGIKV